MGGRKYMKHGSPEWLTLLFGACRLRAKGWSQDRIADRLDVPQSTVSRLLDDARDRKWLVLGRDQFMEDEIGDEYRHLLKAADDQYRDDRDLLRRLRSWLPPDRSRDRARLQLRICQDGEAFAASAAEALMPLLEKASTVGVMYGRTLFTVIQELTPNRSLRGKRCIPLAGDPVHIVTSSQEEYSASWLAADLEQRLTGGRTEEPSLTGVSAYIARRFLGPEKKVAGGNAREKAKTPPIREFFDTLPGNVRILGRRDGGHALVDEVDLLLTGIGIIHDDVRTGTFIRERLRQETNITEEGLRKMIHGDIAGLLLAREKRYERQVAELNRGWTGVQFHDLEHISGKADRGRAPGVVVLAEDPGKAEMIRAVVSQLGTVDTMILSHSLCAALKKL